jgi:precorrin-6x reductase
MPPQSTWRQNYFLTLIAYHGLLRRCCITETDSLLETNENNRFEILIGWAHPFAEKMSSQIQERRLVIALDYGTASTGQ